MRPCTLLLKHTMINWPYCCSGYCYQWGHRYVLNVFISTQLLIYEMNQQIQELYCCNGILKFSNFHYWFHNDKTTRVFLWVMKFLSIFYNWIINDHRKSDKRSTNFCMLSKRLIYDVYKNFDSSTWNLDILTNPMGHDFRMAVLWSTKELNMGGFICPHCRFLRI